MNFPMRNKPRPSVIESSKSVIVPMNTAIKPRQPVIKQAAGVFLFSRVYVQAPTDFAQPPQPVFPADVFSYRRQAPPQHHAFPPFANCFSTRFSRFVENPAHRVYCLFSNASFVPVSIQVFTVSAASPATPPAPTLPGVKPPHLFLAHIMYARAMHVPQAHPLPAALPVPHRSVPWPCRASFWPYCPAHGFSPLFLPSCTHRHSAA